MRFMVGRSLSVAFSVSGDHVWLHDALLTKQATFCPHDKAYILPKPSTFKAVLTIIW